MASFSIIVAHDKNRGIGNKGAIPWRLSRDLQNFAQITSQTLEAGKRNAVIMGARTWESLPERYKPLPGRNNLVLSRMSNYETGDDGVPVFNTLANALLYAELREDIENIFIIGGAQVYTEAIMHPDCTELLITEVLTEHECDTYFPELPKHFAEVERSGILEENGTEFQFVRYVKQV